MIILNDTIYRNLQEQVKKNQEDIWAIQEGTEVLARFGIKVVGSVETAADLPNPATYTGEYGDAILVGTASPYDYYVFTRPFEGQETSQWFDIGEFPVPGPVGPQGPQGVPGEDGKDGNYIYLSSGAPSRTANSGDLNIDVTSGNLYQYTNTWNVVGSLKGPRGIDGVDGNMIYAQPNTPFDVNDGDVWINTGNLTINRYGNGRWNTIANLHTLGSNNTTVPNSYAIGNNNVVGTAYSAAIGRDSEITAGGSYTLGNGLKVITTLSNQTIVGRYNDSTRPTQFAVGYGTDDANRLNAIDIQSDGGSGTARNFKAYIYRGLEFPNEPYRKIATLDNVNAAAKTVKVNTTSGQTYLVGAPSSGSGKELSVPNGRARINGDGSLDCAGYEVNNTVVADSQGKIGGVLRFAGGIDVSAGQTANLTTGGYYLCEYQHIDEQFYGVCIIDATVGSHFSEVGPALTFSYTIGDGTITNGSECNIRIL